jgi:predicted nucleic acid-binding protein
VVATTAVTAAELRYGVARLPDGHRKRELTAVIRGILAEDFHGRVLPFDERASVRYPDVVAGREGIGRPIGVADAQIAAICRDLGAVLATRNAPDFEETGVELINPWKLSPAGQGLRCGYGKGPRGHGVVDGQDAARLRLVPARGGHA